MTTGVKPGDVVYREGLPCRMRHDGEWQIPPSCTNSTGKWYLDPMDKKWHLVGTNTTRNTPPEDAYSIHGGAYNGPQNLNFGSSRSTHVVITGCPLPFKITVTKVLLVVATLFFLIGTITAVTGTLPLGGYIPFLTVGFVCLVVAGIWKGYKSYYRESVTT